MFYCNEKELKCQYKHDKCEIRKRNEFFKYLWFINASPNKVVTEVSKVNAISPFSSVVKKSVHLITTRIEIVVLLDYISVDMGLF